MRLFFFLLLLANAVFFAWTLGYLGGTDAGREPERFAKQIAPDSLRVVVTGDKPLQPLCRLLTGLQPDAAESLKLALSGPGIAVDIKPGEDSARYWVHIPPQPNKAAAEKKVAELRKLSVNDFELELDDGPRQFALTFGFYRSEAAANEFLQGLAKRGVKSARVGLSERPAQFTSVTVSGPTDVLSKRLSELLDKLPDVKAVACP